MAKNSLFKELAKDRYKPLPRDKEIELIKKAKAGDTEARREVIERNLRYVAKMAGKYCSPLSDRYMEFISAGTIGLYKALEKFDPEKGHRFLTFATKYIFHEMYKLLTDDISILSIPIATKRLIIAIYRTLPDLEKLLGRLPTVDELIRELRKRYPKMNIQKDVVVDIVYKKHLVIPLDEVAGTL